MQVMQYCYSTEMRELMMGWTCIWGGKTRTLDRIFEQKPVGKWPLGRCENKVGGDWNWIRIMCSGRLWC